MLRIKLILSMFLVLALASSSFTQRRRSLRPETSGQIRGQQRGARRTSDRPVKSYKDIKYPPLSKLNIPQPTRFVMPNGMVVYLLEDRSLPMINVSTMMRAGSRWEPVNKAGLAAMTGTVMRTGGTKTRDGDALDEELDRLGAIVETFIGDESGGAFVSLLKEDIDRGLPILADILRNPKFPDDKIELAKIEQRDFIARRNDDPAGIAFREFNRIIYGRDSPYGHITEYKTIKAVDRHDLVNFHEQYFQPENVILGVWGDFDAGEMRSKIERAFGGWPRGNRPRPQPPEVDPAAVSRSGVYVINKDDVNQSWVIMGGLGGKRNDPDFYALNVMTYILGGSFASRLFSKVRSEQGLAYAIWSDWGAGWDRPGTFVAVGGTKSETTVQIVSSIKREIDALAQGGVTDEEMARAKDSILKGFAFEFDSMGKIMRRLMSYDYYGYPADYLQRYTENIERVTKTDVARVARQYLKSDQFVVLVLGKEQKFERPLSTLGQVTKIDVTIPPEGK
jgi:zinc protease